MNVTKHIQDSINFIEDNLVHSLSLPQLALVAGYSEYHYSRLFKELVKMSPMNYVGRRKISEAIFMKFSGHTLNDCASRYNFSSASTLSRALKTEFGCNYKEFVKAGGSVELQNRVELKTEEINWRFNVMNKNVWLQSQDSYGHSFPTALASALKYQGYDIDIIDVFGYSGFAFFINATKGLCPSSMSVFDFNTHLDFAFEGLGLKTTSIRRLWDKFDQKDEYRLLAVKEMKKALEENKLPICWDAVIPEWTLILEYNKESDKFLASYEGMQNEISPELIGQREIEILDVTIIDDYDNSNQKERFNFVIDYAVKLAKGQFNIDENYKQGLESYDVFYDAVKIFLDQGFTPADEHALVYHLNMLATARYYGAIFINRHSANLDLVKAAKAYENIAITLQMMLSKARILKSCSKKLSDDYLSELLTVIKDCKEAEQFAINAFSSYLKTCYDK